MTDQLDFPFPLDTAQLAAFLTRWLAIENEQERLREELRVLKKDYEDFFPMRAVLTAVKIVRAQQKLENHPTESMARKYLAVLTELIEQHVMRTQERLDDLTAAIQARLDAGERVAVNMTTGEMAP